MTRKRSIELTDPRALRAVAHPTRLELMGLLRRGGPLTATQAANEIGESPASCSFHFRQLAKYGLVEEAAGGRGRERPWQATATFTEWPTRGPSEEHREAGAVLSRFVVEHYFELAMEWLGREPSESAEWADAQIVADSMLYVTAAELADLRTAVQALVEPYIERLESPASRPDGSRAVSFIQLGFPIEGERTEA
jgi:predicted ArsR family transcriptional regulator